MPTAAALNRRSKYADRFDAAGLKACTTIGFETDRQQMTVTIADRISGCLKGAAIGDAIGKQTETLSCEDVFRWYPHGIRGFEGALVGGDSDSVASIAGGILGAMHPHTVNQHWCEVVESINGHDLVAIPDALARLRH